MKTFSFHETSKKRLLSFLKEHYPWSNQTLQAWIQQNTVRLNHQYQTRNVLLQEGDFIEVLEDLPHPESFPLPHFDRKIQVIRKSKGVLAVEKPSGLPCHPLFPWETETLVQCLLAEHPEIRNIGNSRDNGLLHRIDNETSGVVLLATEMDTYQKMISWREQHLWKKTYRAWVEGAFEKELVIDVPMIHSKTNKRKMKIEPTTSFSKQNNSQETFTRVKPLEIEANKTLVEIEIQTGVRHQIRVHLSSVGFPILGDTLYGSQWKLPRFLLHSYQIAIPSQKSSEFYWTSQETFENFETLL